MAEHRLAANLLLRYDTYSNWMNSVTILMQGEAAVVIFPNSNTITNSNHTPANTPPAVGLKIGDGIHYFDELPWVQAVAADVYNWAKSSSKPTYEASEIIGLQNYIEQYGGGGGGSGGGSGGSSTNSGLYRIVYNENTQKYILQYQDSETGNWVDTTSEISFVEIFQRLGYLENWANGATTNIGSIAEGLVFTIRDEVITQVNKLDYTDTPVNNQFVTAVDESNGKIEVTRRALTAADITSGTLSVSQGGTGTTSFESDSVLVGNGTDAISTKSIATTIENDDRNSIPTTGAIIRYVQTETAGLTGAMHFIGEATVAINPNSGTDPRIQDYNFRNAQPGDVILANNAQEMVWTGAQWRLLGDEGSYAIKGSIVDADINEDANISQSKIENLTTDLSGKVDKVEGKGLSSNDFTNEEQAKLSTVEEYAQQNTIEHIFVNDVERLPTTIANLPKSIDLQISVFDDEHKDKLDRIAAGAQVNEIEHVFVNNNELPIGIINNKAKSVNIQFTEYTAEEKSKLAEIEAEAQENKIESIKINGTTYQPDANKEVSITIDQAALNLSVIEGAVVPLGNVMEAVPITNDKKLQLARIAATGNVQDLLQTADTYIILDCGSSTDVV